MKATVSIKFSDAPDSNKSFSDREEFKGLESEFDIEVFSENSHDLIIESYEKFLEVTKKEENGEVDGK